MECWERGDPPSREYEDLAPIVIVVDSGFGVERFGVGDGCPLPCCTKCSLAPSVMPVLEQPLRQASQQKPLPGRKDEVMALGSCRRRTSGLAKSGSKQGLKDAWEEGPLSLCLSLHTCWSSRPRREANLNYKHNPKPNLKHKNPKLKNSNCWPVGTTTLSFKSSTCFRYLTTISS